MGMRVIGIDSHEKKDFVLAPGAERFIDYRSDDLKAGVLDITNDVGARAAFVLTASHSAYASALSLPKSGGTLVCVGMPISTACPQGLVRTSKLHHEPSAPLTIALYRSPAR